jgi:hypothetical protein
MVFLLYLDSGDIKEWEKPVHPSKLKKKCNYETPYCAITSLICRPGMDDSTMISRKEIRTCRL